MYIKYYSLFTIFYLFISSFIISSCDKAIISNIDVNSDDKENYDLPHTSMFESLLYSAGDYNSAAWRIPVLLSLTDGTLLAVCDKRKLSSKDLPNDIDVVSRYSTDNGWTWSDPVPIAIGKGVDHGCGDPALVQAANGDVLCAYVQDYGTIESTIETPMRSIISRSVDYGRTWQFDLDITKLLWGPNAINSDCRKYTSSFFSSGNGVRLTRGNYKDRLIFVACMYMHDEKYADTEWQGDIIDNYIVYSDDNGCTWCVSQIAYKNGSEAKVVELVDGALLMSVRQEDGSRGFCKSYDGGETWCDHRKWNDYVTTGCNGDMIRFAAKDCGDRENILLHSMPNHRDRYKVSIFASYDEGETWQDPVCLFTGWSAYSSLTVLNDGTIGVLYERYGYDSNGIQLWYTNFTYDWYLSRVTP